jgi:MoaA/NifB/PqqE/SkfB family radical SAM enzyme
MNSWKKYFFNLSRFLVKPLIPPELLILSLTESCNLRCVTCNIKKEVVKESLEIDIDKIFDIVNQANEMRIQTIVLSGGEPFLIKEVFTIVDYIKKFEIKTAVTTNGIYGDQIAEKIAFSQIDHVHFS